MIRYSNIKFSLNMKKLIISLDGGTGNQLFQLLACDNLARKFSRKPFYSVERLGKFRDLEIKKIADLLDIKFFDTKNIKKIRLITESDLCHPAYFSHYSEVPLIKQEEVLLNGFFQNYRMHDKKTIKKLKNFSKKEAQLIYPDSNYIALHIRELQGTWKGKPKKDIDKLSIKYYERSLEQIKIISRENESFASINNVLLFSDMFNNLSKSILFEPVTELIKSKGFNVILGDNLCKTPWQSISLMSNARCVITANSTFSWWGAYLSNNLCFSPILSLWEPLLMTPDDWIQISDSKLEPFTWHKEMIYQVSANLKKERFSTIKKQYYESFIAKLLKWPLRSLYIKLSRNLINKYANLKLRSLLS